jgi:hypothetical protein
MAVDVIAAYCHPAPTSGKMNFKDKYATETARISEAIPRLLIAKDNLTAAIWRLR